MHIKKTYICFEPGEHHPALCVLEKFSKEIGHLKPTIQTIYTVRWLESLPANSTYNDVLQKIRARMKSYVTGTIRIIVGYTYISEAAIKFFEKTNLQPVKITVTGDPESYKENFMFYVTYREIVERMDALKEQETLTFAAGVSESSLREDDDLDLSLGMAVWFAHQDSEKVKNKSFIEFK